MSCYSPTKLEMSKLASRLRFDSIHLEEALRQTEHLK